MRRLALTLAVAVLLLGAYTGIAQAKATEMNGHFVWNNEDQTGDLKAVFTKTGKGMYDVSFHFMWEDEPHVWSGTAEGDLKDGMLKGKVMTDGERQSEFVFSGEVKKGKFEGTHGSMRDGEMNDTGTMALSH